MHIQTTTLFAVCTLATLLGAGIAGAAEADSEHVRSVDPLLLEAPEPDTYTRTCARVGTTSVTGSCSYGAVYITDDTLRTEFILPFLGMGSSHMNLKERTPVVGDYVTYYDRTCASVAPATGDSSYQCFGGYIRSWHYNEYHTFFGEHSWTCLSALHCSATVRATYY